MDDVDASVLGHRAHSKPGFVTCTARFLGNVFSKVFLLYTSGPLGLKLRVRLCRGDGRAAGGGQRAAGGTRSRGAS